MVNVINKKTKQPHSFSDADWQVAIEKGLHTKFKIVDQTAEVNSKVGKNFSPPELSKKNEVKAEAKEKTSRKRNTAE